MNHDGAKFITISISTTNVPLARNLFDFTHPAMRRAKRCRRSRPGPSSYASFFDFATWQLSRWQEYYTDHGDDFEARLAWLGSLTWILTTTYSGVGAAEMALSCWRKAFSAWGVVLNTIFYSVTEKG